ncbi:MAG TPA: phage protein NinX family protein [Pseudomonas sp.]|uniref:phage protein NinX family protein n=1 Tax=Pseudomonas sp. TaxID=306 RepID=UPI002C673348|nr:phage protein NinX family protein [Pseudomonas sp.]HWH86200.1 phage protein NinX family protein [Pseudomonas sp.]
MPEEMIEVKIENLIGPSLDWAVAEAEGIPNRTFSEKRFALFGSLAIPIGNAENGYAPSACWHCGGPLIKKHHVNLHSPQHSDDVWVAWVNIRGNDFAQGADQPLVAVCRAIVSAKLGDVVSVPAELIQTAPGTCAA